jgi:hypothetical protein
MQIKIQSTSHPSRRTKIVISFIFNTYNSFLGICDSYISVNRHHSIPKLLFPSQIAIISFLDRISRVEYSGKSIVLKLYKLFFTKYEQQEGN